MSRILSTFAPWLSPLAWFGDFASAGAAMCLPLLFRPLMPCREGARLLVLGTEGHYYEKRTWAISCRRGARVRVERYARESWAGNSRPLGMEPPTGCYARADLAIGNCAARSPLRKRLSASRMVGPYT